MLSIALAGCGGGGSNVIAIVNGDPITRDDFVEGMQLKSNVNVIVVPQQLQAANGQIGVQQYSGQVADGTVGFQTLKELVNQRLILQLAAEQGVSPSKADVEAEIEYRKKENPNFLKQAQANGFSLDFLRSNLTTQLAQEKIITRGITITAADVDKFIKDNPKEFITPASVEVLFILAKDAKDRDLVDQELKSGQSFEVVAQHYSADPNGAKNNYHLLSPSGTSYVKDYAPAVQKILNGLAEQQQSEWYPEGTQYIKFFLRKKVKDEPITIDDVIRRKVQRALAMDEGKKSIDFANQVLNKLKAAKVDVKIDAFKLPFEQYLDGLKAQGKAEAAAGSGTTGTTGGTGGTAGTTDTTGK